MERGDLELDAPVRRYLPEFALQDEDVAQNVTVMHLLNHTAGWEGDLSDDTGDGDDALERYVALMKDIKQVTPLGATVSYNNASLSVAGRIIEKITGTTYEKAMRDLLARPIGSGRHAVPHDRDHDASLRGRAHPRGRRHDQARRSSWAIPRGNGPAGGMSATARDQIAWARFNLGDGTAPDGTRMLSAESLRADARADGVDAGQRDRRSCRHQLAAA